MKLSHASSYALHALTHLAEADGNPLVTSAAVAGACGIPEFYLLKLLRPMVTAGVLHSLRGPNGGFRLARPAKQITFLEVVEAVDGPLHGLAPAVATPASAALDGQLAAICDRAADAV